METRSHITSQTAPAGVSIAWVHVTSSPRSEAVLSRIMSLQVNESQYEDKTIIHFNAEIETHVIKGFPYDAHLTSHCHQILI